MNKDQAATEVKTQAYQPVKTILLPTDFSETSQNAFRYARQLAQAMRAKLIVAHIYPGQPQISDYVWSPVKNLVQSGRTQEALKRLDEFSQTEEPLNVPIEFVLEPGDPTVEIARLGRELEVDLIVVGTRGLRSEINKTFGSVTAEVVNSASCPVLIIPEHASYRGIHHIMYASTLGEDDLSVLDELIAFSEPFDARISVTNVNIQPEKWYEVENKMLEVVIQVRQKSQKVALYQFNHPDLLQGLDEFIQETSVDLVVMRTHRRDLFDVVLGNESMVQTMSLYTDTPLLAYHV